MPFPFLCIENYFLKTNKYVQKVQSFTHYTEKSEIIDLKLNIKLGILEE